MKSKSPKTLYICKECGHEHPKWNGQCTSCRSWNTLEEVTSTPMTNSRLSLSTGYAPAKMHRLGEIGTDEGTRIDTGIGELNRVLGGGLVRGAVVLLSGEPGIGKSTLLLQICDKARGKILYATGEESVSQIKLRADRVKIKSDDLFITQSTDLPAIITLITNESPDIVIIDSIQTMRIDEINSAQGSVTQVRECTNLLISIAKTKGIPIFIIGHINKDGGIAGPKVLEHIVDTVLYFEGDRRFSYRILRAAKNRFGSTNEIGVFEMRGRGLREVENPSAMLLSGRPTNVSGISVLCTMEGSRPILAEVQALVAKSGFSAPRRVSDGFDYNRLCLIIAVLEKRGGFFYGGLDVYLNIIGGINANEPAADLAVALALYSALCDIRLPETLAVFGEIGLGGEIRTVNNVDERIRECSRIGFDTCIVPKRCFRDTRGQPKTFETLETNNMKIIGAANIVQMFKAVDAISVNKL